MPPPRFGSRAWLNLPDESAPKIAAILVAALSSLRSDDELASDLQSEIDQRWLAAKRNEDAAYAERAAAHRESAPRWAESFVERRRRQLVAAGLVPEDFLGGAT